MSEFVKRPSGAIGLSLRVDEESLPLLRLRYVGLCSDAELTQLPQVPRQMMLSDPNTSEADALDALVRENVLAQLAHLSIATGRVMPRTRLGGILNFYHREAA